MNAGTDEVDKEERALVLAQAMLNGYLTFASIEGLDEAGNNSNSNNSHSKYFYERQFDAVLARFAGACMGEGLRQRALSAVRLTRTREVLGLLAQMATQLNCQDVAEQCLRLTNNFLAEDARSVSDNQLLPQNVQAQATDMAPRFALYGRRVDDMAFAFGSGDARERFRELEAVVRMNVDDSLSRMREELGEWRRKGSQTG